MLLVTTLSYDQFSSFIKNKQVSLNNANLIFGQDYEPVSKYMQDRLGSSGYVMGIRGRINNKSVDLLSRLDEGLNGDRMILEVDVADDDVLTFSVDGLEEAVKLMAYGLPDEMVYDQFDASLSNSNQTRGVQVVCAPTLDKTKNIRVTALNREVVLDVEGITFVQI